MLDRILDIVVIIFLSCLVFFYWYYILFYYIMEKKVIPYKHGVKCSKRDVVLDSRYVVVYLPFQSESVFKTKLEAIEMINLALQDSSISSDDFKLLKVQFIKF